MRSVEIEPFYQIYRDKEKASVYILNIEIQKEFKNYVTCRLYTASYLPKVEMMQFFLYYKYKVVHVFYGKDR